jgi:hypothetical protein
MQAVESWREQMRNSPAMRVVESWREQRAPTRVKRTH